MDPANLGPLVARLGFNAKRSGKVALGIASALLEEGEQAESLVVGRHADRAAVAVATPTRVLVVNDREWKPDLRIIPIQPGLTVRGWQDERAATLSFEWSGEQVVVERIGEREIAQEMARIVRSRAGG